MANIVYSVENIGRGFAVVRTTTARGKEIITVETTEEQARAQQLRK